MAEIAEIAEAIIKNAEAEAEKILRNSKTETSATLTKLQEEHRLRMEAIESDELTQINLINKRFEQEEKTILTNAAAEAKLKFFEEIIGTAKEIIKTLPGKEYCLFLDRLISANKPGKNSVICFGSEDKKRLSKAFFADICKKYSLKNGESFEGHGFIIKEASFSDVVTIDSLFEEKKPEIMQRLREYEAGL